MTSIRINPNEYAGLVDWLYRRVQAVLPLPIGSRSVYDQVLVEYWQKANLLQKVGTWQFRNSRQRYLLPMPVSVMKILHQEMQHVELSIFAQAFLATLDQYLTNHP